MEVLEFSHDDALSAAASSPQTRASMFRCVAAGGAQVNCLICHIFLGFSELQPLSDVRRRSHRTSFPYGMALDALPPAVSRSASIACSSSELDRARGLAASSNWLSPVVWLPEAIFLAEGDALQLEWHVDAGGAHSAAGVRYAFNATWSAADGALRARWPLKSLGSLHRSYALWEPGDPLPRLPLQLGPASPPAAAGQQQQPQPQQQQRQQRGHAPGHARRPETPEDEPRAKRACTPPPPPFGFERDPPAIVGSCPQVAAVQLLPRQQRNAVSICFLVTGPLLNPLIWSSWLGEARRCGIALLCFLHSSVLDPRTAAWCAAERVVILPAMPTAWGDPSIVLAVRALFDAAAAASGAASHAALVSQACIPLVPAAQLARVFEHLEAADGGSASRFKLGEPGGLPPSLRASVPGWVDKHGAVVGSMHGIVSLSTWRVVSAPAVWNAHFSTFAAACPAPPANTYVAPAAGAGCSSASPPVSLWLALDECLIQSLMSMYGNLQSGVVTFSRWAEGQAHRAALCDEAWCSAGGASLASLRGVLAAAAWRGGGTNGAGGARQPLTGYLFLRKFDEASAAGPVAIAMLRDSGALPPPPSHERSGAGHGVAGGEVPGSRVLCDAS